MTAAIDVCVVSPFRKPLFRHAVSNLYPVSEPWDSPQYQVAAVLENAGYSVSVLPLQTLFASYSPVRDQDALDSLLAEHPCRILLFASDHFVASRSTATVYGIETVLASLKRLGMTPTAAVMGRLATTASESLLKYLNVSACLLGECDLHLPDFVARVLAGRSASVLPFVATAGKCYGLPARISNLKDLPCPAFHLAEPMIDWGRNNRRISTDAVPFSMRSSAGCALRCKFCAGVPDWNNWRAKGRAQFEAEVSFFGSALGSKARLVFLEDELLTFDANHAEMVSEVLLGAGLRLAGFYTHSRFIDASLATKLAKAFDRVYLGMDSADDRVLKSMNKGQTAASFVEALGDVRGSGLGVHIECVIGSPHESRESLLRSIAAIHNLILVGLADSANTYVFAPHPGTAFSTEVHPDSTREFGEMQESGGYPQTRTTELTQNEVFSGYLISQIVISEAMQHVRRFGLRTEVGEPDFEAFSTLFSKIAGESI